MSAPITIRGNLTRDPKLNFSQAGKGVVNFTVVTSRRVKNRRTEEWEDAGTTYWECVAFDSDYYKVAENIAETLEQGMAVIVHGIVEADNWEDKNGNKRTSLKLMVDDCGPSLRNAHAKVVRVARGSGGSTARAADDPPF